MPSGEYPKAELGAGTSGFTVCIAMQLLLWPTASIRHTLKALCLLAYCPNANSTVEGVKIAKSPTLRKPLGRLVSAVALISIEQYYREEDLPSRSMCNILRVPEAAHERIEDGSRRVNGITLLWHRVAETESWNTGCNDMKCWYVLGPSWRRGSRIAQGVNRLHHRDEAFREVVYEKQRDCIG